MASHKMQPREHSKGGGSDGFRYEQVRLVRAQWRQPVRRGAQQRLGQAHPRQQLVRQQVECALSFPVRPQLSSCCGSNPPLIGRGLFLLRIFLPRADHSSYFIQQRRQVPVLLIVQAFHFPSHLKEEFEQVEFGARFPQGGQF